MHGSGACYLKIVKNVPSAAAEKTGKILQKTLRSYLEFVHCKNVSSNLSSSYGFK